MEIVRRRPLVGGWGTSQDRRRSRGLVVEVAHRLSETSVTLDMSGSPDSHGHGGGHRPQHALSGRCGRATPDERARKVQAGLQGDLGKRVLNLPAGLGTH